MSNRLSFSGSCAGDERDYRIVAAAAAQRNDIGFISASYQLRLQGIADRRCAPLRTHRSRVVLAGWQQVRGLALSGNRGHPAIVSASVNAVTPLSRRYRIHERSADRRPLDKLAD